MATVLPAKAADANQVSWASSDETVARVADGVVSAHGYADDEAGHMALTFGSDLDLGGGVVELYALSEEGGWEYLGDFDEAGLAGQTFVIPGPAVKVVSGGSPRVTDVTTFEDEFGVSWFNVQAPDAATVGDTFTARVTDVEPDVYAGMRLPMTWDSSDSVAQIGADGTFCAEQEDGRAYVAATIHGVRRYAYFEIAPEPDPEIRVTKITLSGLSNKIAAGKKVKLTAKVLPADATNKAVTWKSSNTKVAKVSAAGVVTMVKGGAGKSVTITCTAKDGSGKKATYKITSMKGVVKRVTLKGATSVKAGKALTLKAKVSASKGANTKLKWTCSNTKLATVSAKGKVTAKKGAKGKTVTITCMATDGSGKKATKKIKIK